jgi:two-component system response regulator PilR (NtrC family)/two-component system response regulator HydG
MPDRILLVEDDRELREFLKEVLEATGYSVSAHSSAGRALSELLGRSVVDLVMTDLIMPGMGGGELMAEVHERRPELNVIVLTAFGTIESAIELVKAGASDYLTKPFATDELLLAVERALEESRLRREVAKLKRLQEVPPGFVGASRPMQELFSLIRRVAPSSLPALITGETGSGKEVVASAIHRLSGRGAFVAVNCAALPEHLLESELFGHIKGSFTGADRDKPGLFEAADGGTILLDEVGDLPKTLQPKLLRVVEDGEVRRVGASKGRRVDVRVVAATNRDLEAAVHEGTFREDLFWRLNVVSVRVPALRDRSADVPLLAEHFLQRFVSSSSTAVREISAPAMALMTAYPWPGNVRELRSVVERAAALGVGPRIEPADLPQRVRDVSAVMQVADASQRGLTLRELERRYITEILRQTDGNRSRAAEVLGVDRKTLYRKLQEHDRAQVD